MKKTYSTPVLKTFALDANNAMMITSIPVESGSDKITEEGGFLSNGNGWSSDNWAGSDED